MIGEMLIGLLFLCADFLLIMKPLNRRGNGAKVDV